MSLYLGSPVEEFLAIADTGSDLIWVQCKPCEECYPQKAPLFDPHASSTYKVISCNTDSCSSLPHTSCGEGSQCEYNYGYGDGSLVDGFLSSETLSFASTGGRRIQVPSTLFGCTHRSNGTFTKNGAGLVGLGGGKLSLIRQLGSSIESKFSYCLPSSSQTSATGRLNFGASANVSASNAVTTPLITGFSSTFYFLSLEQVSVEGQGAVKVKPGMQIGSHTEQGNIIIDSGTTLTLVDDETLKSIAAKVASSVMLPQVKDPNNDFNLCFNVSGVRANAQFPDITFQFAGGASVVLHQSNAFVEAAQNVVCMSLVSSAGIGVNIFGNVAQQNFHIGYNLDAALSSTDNIYSKIVPNSFEYLMSLYLGSPVEEFLAIADTGSDLIWVQCKPCEECYPQKAPLFDPHASSTYKVISCNTDSCSSLPHTSCGEGSQCEYNYGYGDGSLVDGFLSSETLSFDSTGGRRIQVPSTLFGCTHRSNGTFSKNGAGLVGLGGGKLSLIRQLGSSIESKFSYCLPSSSQTSATGRLNFGASANVSASNAITTPLITGFSSTFYFLSLEQVSVEGQGAVKVKPGMQIGSHTEQGNIIIDSGTTLTLVDDETLKSIAAKVASSVKLPQVKDPNNDFNLCFNVSGVRANAQFPDITFQFAGGASVVLHQSNAFVEAAQNVVCMSLVSSAGIGVNIFGNVAQQNFHIGYNLDAMQLTFAPADCANL
ncbi:Aspartic proteinase CDR1 [Platanthera guangdongensis]|uniref:Aspartic proteinase CDR1 n=1 Tax=Platanthera guangdongensis TaxID=2320717 RepID=A0ABR2MBJ5_9ASPA